MLEFYRHLFAYDDWANDESLRSLAQFPAPPTKALKIMAHILGTQWVWMARLRREPNPAVWPEWDLQRCRSEAKELHVSWMEFLQSLDENTVRSPVSYTNSKGERFTNTPEQILMHVMMHGAYHRGQVAREVREAGGTPAYTDFIEAVRRGMPVSA